MGNDGQIAKSERVAEQNISRVRTTMESQASNMERTATIASVLQNRDCLHFQIQPEAAEFEKLPFTFFRYVCYSYRNTAANLQQQAQREKQKAERLKNNPFSAIQEGGY